MKNCISLFVAAFGLVSCQTAPPSVSLATDPDVHKDMETRRYRVGQILYNSPPYVVSAEHPTTTVRGHWGPRSSHSPHQHTFFLEVEQRNSRETTRFLKGLKGQNGDCLSFGLLRKLSVYGRFSRRVFPWGNAVSFVSLDNLNIESPANGMMTYEILGCTKDRKYFCHFSVGITHPSWPSWPSEQQRAYNSQEELNRDPDVKLLPKLRASSFTPDLSKIDAFISSLKIE